ncbi:MAG: ATP-binding cassette domain-containing protein [Alphaproteobacteria bacterium]|nr:ATP-binding cassette domain-containing protein [Alphaproteobacteria bacterium]
MSDAFLSVEGLTIVTPTGATLVENAAFALGRSEVVLLIGPSGCGKSTIINVLSGLLDRVEEDWRITGRLVCDGQSFDLEHQPCDVGGLVFQGNALFDDLTVAENLRIAADHANGGERLAAHATALLREIRPEQPVASCSGGQQQRVGIARTVLADRPVLLLDEPNSGLDKRAGQRLAAMVRGLCHDMGKPAIIVAHHVDELLPLADRVLLLDPVRRRLVHLPPDAQAVERALDELEGATLGERDESAAPAVWPIGRRRNWPSHYLREYFWVLCASPLMLAYVAAGAMIIGFVTVWFGFNYDTLGDYVKSLVHDEALMGIGLIQSTVAVPLIACILVVARNNAIITADIGNRVLSSQLRAMRNLHIPGRRYLVTAILGNLVLGSVLLVAAAQAVAAWTSLQTWRLLFPGQPFELWRENFFHLLLRTPLAAWEHAAWMLLKVILSVALSGGLAIGIGLSRKDSVLDINYAIAQSIVGGVTVTLVIHAVVAVFQF